MNGGPHDFHMISVEDYWELVKDDGWHTLEELHANARSTGACEVCGQPIWRLVNNGMCFTCTTGEADASDDYELIPEPDDEG